MHTERSTVGVSADMHMHSTFSDGTLDPCDLAARVRRAGIDVMALTDHDTTAGIEKAARACQDAGLGFIPGVEISTACQGDEVHLLGYGIETDHAPLQLFLDEQERLRAERADRFMERLIETGALPEGTQLDRPPDGGAIGRPHLADALVDAGTVQNRQEAFQRFLGKHCSTFVPKQFPDTVEAIRLVQQAGGATVIAHPGHSTSHGVLLGLVEEGLDGVEVVHPAHDAILTEYYSEQADRFGLMKTGGSDYHGPVPGRPDLLGVFTIRPGKGILERLRTQW